VIAAARVVAEADAGGVTRLRVLRSAAPLLLRPTPAGVYLVGGAGGPLGGDDLRLQIEVGAGASLTVRTAASSVILPGPHGGASRFEIEATVGHNGFLCWLPEPTVAAGRCCHRACARVITDARATVVWREELLLGRHGEAPGSYDSAVALDIGSRPVLRQNLSIGGLAPGWSGPAVTGDCRAVGSVVVVDPAWIDEPPPSVMLDRRASVLALPGPAVQVTALADDAVDLRRLLDLGMERAEPVRGL